MGKFLLDHLYRLAIATLLAATGTLLSGCVVSQLRIGLATDPIGPYLAIDWTDPAGPGNTITIGGPNLSGTVNGYPTNTTTKPATAVDVIAVK